LLRLHTEEGDEFSPDAFREEGHRLQTEISSAEQSLAETETRLRIETDQLKMALELAQDITALCTSADEQTKRSINQAFFTKLYVLPEPDAPFGIPTARIDGAELTKPYAALLADDLVENIRSELQKAESDPKGSLSPTAVSNVEDLAGATGLEPATSAVTGQRSNQLSYAPAFARTRYERRARPLSMPRLGRHRTIHAKPPDRRPRTPRRQPAQPAQNWPSSQSVL
jgi:hypothetical protein